MLHLLYELTTGAEPFKEKGFVRVFQIGNSVFEGQRPTIMRQCWVPEERPIMQQVVDRILTEPDDFVEGCDKNEYDDHDHQKLN